MSGKPIEIPVQAKDPKPEKGSGDLAKLSEEDERIKEQVELLVTRAADRNLEISKTAVEQLVDLLRTSSSGSVASVPKPLKYVRSLYPELELVLKGTSDAVLARRLHDVLSFVSMTLQFSVPRVSLDHKLKGTTSDLEVWGHEYLRFLAGQIGDEWKLRVSQGESPSYLSSFVDQIIEFMVRHQDDPTAIDLLIEIDAIQKIVPLVGETNYKRVAGYIEAVSSYLTRPADTIALQTVFQIYAERKSFPNAVSIGLRLGDREALTSLMAQCDEKAAKLQMALQCARFKLFLGWEAEEDELLQEANGNMRLSEMYRRVAQDLDCMEPKAIEDIFRNASNAIIPAHDSLYSLSCAFASSLANCGYGKDSHLNDKEKIYFEQREDRVISTVSAFGLLHLWDHVDGLQRVNQFFYGENHYFTAGACLATGLILCGIQHPFDPAPDLLAEHLQANNRDVLVGAVLGMGYACAGTQREDVKEMLIPIMANAEQPLEVQCMTAYALAMVFVGTGEEDISETMIHCLLETPESSLLDPAVRYLILALGCMFLGRQEAVDTLLDACQALPISIRRYTDIVLRSCAFAGTGNVVVIQNLFSIVAENDDPLPTETKEAPAAGTAAAPAAPSQENEEKPPEEEKLSKEAPQTLNYKAVAVIGIGLVALGEGMGTEMTKRSVIHLLLADTVSRGPVEMSGRRAVPLVFALLSTSDPHISVVENLNRFAHDSDAATASTAILALGLVGAGTQNARVVSRLSSLAAYYKKPSQSSLLFAVRLAQSLCAMGKGNLTLSPLQNDRRLISPTALMGLLGLLHSALDMEKTLLERYHFMFYAITPSISPRMMVVVDENMEVIPEVQVRVGAPVDTVALPGNPRTITGFQTQKTPILLGVQEKIEIGDPKYVPVASVLEGIIVVKEKGSGGNLNLPEV